MPVKKIRKPFRYFLLVLIAFLSSEITLALEKERTLTAATLKYPPYGYIEDDQPKGIAVDIIKEAIKRTGLSGVVFSFYPWKRAVLMTKTGHSDILFNAGKNLARQQWGEYVESVLILQKYVLFKRKNANFSINQNFQNVKSHIISVRLGYLYGNGSFKQAIDTNKFKDVILSKSTAQSVATLLNNKADLFVGDYLPVIHYLKENDLLDRIEIVHNPGTTDNMVVLDWPTYILFSKKTVERKYVDEVNNAMELMKADGTFQRIYSEYIQHR